MVVTAELYPESMGPLKYTPVPLSVVTLGGRRLDWHYLGALVASYKQHVCNY